MSPVCLPSPAAGAPLLPAWPGPAEPPPRPAARAAGERSLRAAVRRQGLQAAFDLPALCAAVGQEPAALLAAHGTVFNRAESPLKTRRLQGPWPALAAALAGFGRLQLQMWRPGQGRLRLDGDAPALLAALQPHDEHWAQQAWAMEERLPGGELRRSVQLLGAQGRPQAALVLAPEAQLPAFFALVETFGALDLRGTPPPCRPLPPRAAVTDGAAQRHQGWPSLRQRDAAEALHELLWRAMQGGLGLRLGLHHGALSLHAEGELRRLSTAGGLLLLEASGLQLQLEEAAVAELRCLRISKAGGVQHRVEALDADGERALDLQARTPPGQREPCAWRLLVDSVGRDAMEPA
ncbi:MAG: hypothetical protein QM750_17510 [Rubrivivax sp.]